MDEILSGKPREDVVDNIHSFLRTTADDIRNSRVPIEKFVVTKGTPRNVTDNYQYIYFLIFLGISKAPETYTDVKGQPHVVVAQRLQKMVTLP